MKKQATTKGAGPAPASTKVYTNQELAALYFSHRKSFNEEALGAEGPYRPIMRRISEIAMPIHPFYLRRGSLTGLKLRGLGDKTKTILETLLRHGPSAFKQTEAVRALRLEMHGSNIRLPQEMAEAQAIPRRTGRLHNSEY